MHHSFDAPLSWLLDDFIVVLITVGPEESTEVSDGNLAPSSSLPGSMPGFDVPRIVVSSLDRGLDTTRGAIDPDQ